MTTATGSRSVTVTVSLWGSVASAAIEATVGNPLTARASFSSSMCRVVISRPARSSDAVTCSVLALSPLTSTASTANSEESRSQNR